VKLTPFLVARAQLLTAIDLFFADRDPISVQALAGNAREILESLCRIAGIEPMTEMLLRDHPDKTRKDIYTAANLYRNCFKHVGKTEAERAADQATLDQFKEPTNEFLLYVCVEDYVRFRQAMPVPLQVFQAWFCALHLDLLTTDHDPDLFRKHFPGILQMSRRQQKELAAEMIARWSNDHALLADPRTEPVDVT
jgi:hypothetical protein